MNSVVTNLTQSQLLLWTGQELNPDAPLYNMVLTFDLKGALDVDHFRLAFQKLVDQSDAMRTVFEVKEGVPMQQVRAKFQYSIEVVDLSGEPDKKTVLNYWIQEHSNQIFDLSTCVFESVLILLAPDHFVWYLNQHHLITDAWAVSVQYKAMAEFYRNSIEGKFNQEPVLPLFQEYVLYESKMLMSAVNEQTSAYWNNKTQELPPSPRLYGFGDQVFTSSSERISVALGIERSNKLRTLTQEEDLRAWTQHLSLYNIFITVLFAYLYRVSGQRNLAIGTPAHNRPTPVFKETPGVFIELYPLFTDIEDHYSFVNLLQQIRTEVNGFLRYAQPGATKVALNRSFNVVLNYIHAVFSDFNDIPMKSNWVHPGHCDPHHYLRLHVHDFDDSGNIQLHFDLNTEVFDQTQFTTVPKHFLALLDAFIEDRTQPINKALLLSEQEIQQTVYNLNETAKDLSGVNNVVDLFVLQAEEIVEAPALRFQGQSISFQLLNEKSNQLAHYLIQQNIGPGKNVALYLKRSKDLIIGILGVLKAGAAYVPIASNYPPERVKYIIDDVDAALVLTCKVLDKVGKITNSIRLDVDWDKIASQPKSRPQQQIYADHLAYIMYTSGSSGAPKGVMISHKALANYVLWAKATYVGNTKPVFPLFTMIAFDLTMTSVFLPLISGGSIVIYEENDTGPDLSLLQVVEDNLIDVIKLTPSHLALLKDKDLSGSRIKTVIVGGEDFKTQLAKEMMHTFGSKVSIYNEYGPTEATIGCVVHKFEEADLQQPSMPIGTSIWNMKAYVLDDRLNPVPQGVTGELFLSGTGLANGYWEHPKLTQKQFVSNPFSVGERMYGTGDLVRLNTQNQLEYLERRDQQIKIGGLRVEPGEIEAALIEHPAVSNCVVDLQVRRISVTSATVANCSVCGLPSNYPSSDFDQHGVCHLCRSFENYQQKAKQYFKEQTELKEIFRGTQSQKRGDYDCIMLLSGGKDSTYALAKLVEMGLKVLAYTLDNGYISDQAKTNIKKVVETLGVDHIFGQTPAMNAIFVDSLKRHCNVCNGCFKTIYTLSTNLAVEKGIPVIVTGLSRGQFFETRLTEELFNKAAVDFDQIDQTILEARKVYHRTDDAVNRLLDVSVFKDDKIFEQVQFIDYYRFSDVSMDEMMAYLDKRLPWVRPTDTGRSTNCLINQVGISVHRKERGYSNYAFPYSWDVRMGHKTREASIEEVNEQTDELEVHRIMDEIGYQQIVDNNKAHNLVAYYVSTSAVSHMELHKHLARYLPDFMIPTHFMAMEKMPLTANGKINRKSLPGLDEKRPDIEVAFRVPETQVEEMLSEIWSEVLQIPEIGIDDDFLQLGGNSLAAIRLTARINEAFELDLPLNRVFEYPTIAGFGEFVAHTIDALLSEEERNEKPGINR